MFGSAFTARQAAAAVVGATVLIAGMALVAPASAAPAQTGPPAQVLERDMRGEAAISALGSRLPEVAAQNDMSAAEFRTALREDSMLWVSRTGQLLFVDDLGHDHADSTTEPSLATTVAPLDQTFRLHSRPGSNRVVYLDFDGHDARGTGWGSTDAQVAKAYDADNVSGFNDAERATIQDVWARVAEDFAPFAVDVTTEDPGIDAIRRSGTGDTSYGTRLVVTPTNAYGDCGCGGVAYVGVFNHATNHDWYQPAWVFTAGVGNGAKTIAEAASHEIGHNLGLSHDGTNSIGYYKGHGSWAPIMGVGYNRAITQWSEGEYSGANNTENDLTRMQAFGAPAVADDHGGTTAAATPLTSSASGLIGNRLDVDAFSVAVTTPGAVTISVQPAAVSPNLDVGLRLVSPSGATLLSVDPPSGSTSSDLSTGLGAELTLDLAAGTHTIFVDGVGFGSPSTTGYSDYGSLGRYTVTATVPESPPGEDPPPPAPDPTPPAAPDGIQVSSSEGTVTVTWADKSSNETGFEIARETANRKNGRWGGFTLLSAEAGAMSLTDSTGAGTFRYQVRAVNDVGASAWTAWVETTVSTTSGGGGGGGKGKSANVR